MRQKKEEGIAVHCSVHQLEDYFLSGYERDLSPSSVLSHLLSLKRYVNRYIVSPRFPEIPLEPGQISLRASAGDAIESVDYSPFSAFDSFFIFWVSGSREFGFPQFDRIVNEVLALDKGRIDLELLKPLLKSLFQVFKPKSSTEVIVVKHAIYRVFFDRLYLKKPSLLEGNDGDRRKLANQCERVRWLTPRQMSIPEKIMKPEMMDVAFALLAQRTVQLQQAVGFISSLHFLTNPIDIMATVFSALKAGEEFVKQNSFEKRFGRWVSMFDREKVSGVADQLAFDDFFPMFCLMFSLAPPANAISIANLLSQVSGVSLSPAFDFAKLFFTSTVQYLRNVNLADLMAADDDDEDDPLGLLHLRSSNKGQKVALFS
jgi:hypothetical protein